MATPLTFDKDLEIQASTTDTADDVSAAFAFPLDAVHPRNDEHDQKLVIVVDVTALTLGGGTLDFYVEVDTASGFASGVKVETLRVLTVGRHRMVIDLATVALLEPGATHLRVGADWTGGAGPSVTWRAYAVKC